MSLNEGALHDEDDDAEDWIELFNKGNTPVNLSPYYLSDDSGNLHKWQFPDITLFPQEFLIVFCSSKNRDIANMPLHTNFKLSSAGEDIIFSSNEFLVQHIPPVTLGSNQSYSSIPDGSQNFFTGNQSTPGASNTLGVKVNFSEASGFYEQGFHLELSPDLFFDNIELRYTKNGDNPDTSSSVFEQSILIEDRTEEENTLSQIPTTPDYSNWTEEPTYPGWANPENPQAKGTVIKAAAFIDGIRVSEIFTQTYFVFPEGRNRFSLPVLSISCPQDSLFGEERGIYVPGIHLEEDNIVWSGNYYKEGKDWERLANIEYFVNGEKVINQPAGLRIHGGKTRSAAQKTMKIYARSEYGINRFDYPFFKNKDQQSYKRLLIRSSMGCWHHTILKDAYAHQMAGNLNMGIQEFQPVIVFINGEYWGLHELREKIDRFKLAEDNGLDPDSIKIYGSWGSVLEGPLDLDFYTFRDQFLANNDITDPEVYNYVKSKIDIDNIIDYFLSELYINNTDWPGNNLKMWRSAEHDNKWRWIFYDLDGGFGETRLSSTIVQDLLDDSELFHGQAEWTTIIIRTLIKNETFKNKFIARAKYLLQNEFTPDRLFSILTEMETLYENDLPEHFDRWANWSSFPEWKANINLHLKNYVLLRSCAFETQLIDYFDIEPFLNCDQEAEQTITIFPNPTDGLINLDFSQISPEVFQCHIYNNLGQVVHRQSVYPSMPQSLDMHFLPAGLYHLFLFDGNMAKQFAQKIIKY
jgi:hypothetical protein